MGQYLRKTFNDIYKNREMSGPTETLQFLRRRRTGALGGTATETAGVGLAGWALGGPIGAAALIANYSAAWGVASLPFEAGRAAVKTFRFLERLGQTGQEFGGPVVDTRMAYTMRQASLQAMHNSAYSLRGAIGNEATLLHS